MSANNEGSGWVWVLVIVAGVCMLLQAISSNSPAPPTNINQNSAEHRYVQRRFEQEGFSSQDAKTAANAVIKFHEAQKNK